MATEILGNLSRFDMRQHAVALFDDGDMQAALDQRQGDFHTQKTRAQHHGMLDAGVEFFPQLCAFGRIAQVVNAGQVGAWHRHANRLCAGGDQ